jgi:hypothetical protein
MSWGDGKYSDYIRCVAVKIMQSNILASDLPKYIRSRFKYAKSKANIDESYYENFVISIYEYMDYYSKHGLQ